MADTLIESQLDRDAGIGAREHRREWFLLFDCVLFEDRKVLLTGGEMARREASIAIHQFLQRSTGAELALRQNRVRGGELHARGRSQRCQCAPDGRLQEPPSGRIPVQDTGIYDAMGAAELPWRDIWSVARRGLF